MREMKDSGVEWIGKIPNGWALVPNKRVMSKKKNICESYAGENVLSLTMNGVIIRDLDNPSGKMPLSFDGYQYVVPGNLLMCLFDIDVTPRCVGVIENYGVTSPAYSQFAVSEKANVKYYYYYYLNLDYKKVLLHLAKNLRHSLTESQLGDVLVPYPEFEEQVKIASYLDSKCSQIDTIIEKQQAVIEKLKEYKLSLITEAVTKGLNPDVPMKDSGVEWIGDIPVMWNVSKISNMGVTSSGATPFRDKEKEFFTDANIKWVRTLDLNDGYVIDSSEKITELALNSSSCSIMPKNTVCVAMYGGAGTIGKCGILLEECATNQAVCSIVCNNHMYPYYLLYQLIALKKYWMKYAVGTRKDPNISQDIVGRMNVVVPNMEEQRQIADFLDRKCSAIDATITKKQAIIEKLTAYKKSLIYEVVTGKKEV